METPGDGGKKPEKIPNKIVMSTTEAIEAGKIINSLGTRIRENSSGKEQAVLFLFRQYQDMRKSILEIEKEMRQIETELSDPDIVKGDLYKKVEVGFEGDGKEKPEDRAARLDGIYKALTTARDGLEETCKDFMEEIEVALPDVFSEMDKMINSVRTQESDEINIGLN